MGKYLTASIAYRGKMGTRDSEAIIELPAEPGANQRQRIAVEQASADYQNKHSQSFVPWVSPIW